jgi:quinol-cytochrome oxidoreductase complex cytochrome b subunit
MGKIVGIMISGVPFMLLFLWPFIERSPGRHPRRRRWAMRLGYFAVFLALFFGLLGYVSETTWEFASWKVEFDMYGVPHVMRAWEHH